MEKTGLSLWKEGSGLKKQKKKKKDQNSVNFPTCLMIHGLIWTDESAYSLIKSPRERRQRTGPAIDSLFLQDSKDWSINPSRCPYEPFGARGVSLWTHLALHTWPCMPLYRVTVHVALSLTKSPFIIKEENLLFSSGRGHGRLCDKKITPNLNTGKRDGCFLAL